MDFSNQFFFANSFFWRIHVNSGQIYIVYIFLLSLAWFLLNSSAKYKNILSGFFVGLTASLRPPFLLFFIPFLIQRQYSFLLGGFTGILFGFLASLAVANIFIWKSYISAILGMTGIINLNQYLPLDEPRFNNSIIYPKIIEGIAVNIDSPVEYKILEDSSIYRILNFLNIPHVVETLIIGAIITIALLSLLIIQYNSNKKDLDFMFLFGSLICLISDFFIPIARYSYYDIQWILPLAIIYNKVNSAQLLSNKLIVLLLPGLLLALGCFSWIPKFLFFSSFLIGFYVLLTSSMIIQQNPKDN